MTSGLKPNIDQLASRPAPDADAWLLGKSPSIRKIARHAEKAAEVQCTVLVTGETGTGKELWAKTLHDLSARRDAPFVPVNCAALTVSLAESQLFGHEKGAFTGAAGSSLGIFRAAEGGVVFLDEVGEMPLELQPKLLRVLQQNEVTPVGAAHPIPINTQIIAATNRDLEQEVAEGRFREDLYYRLNMVELKVPALRERTEDIPAFVEFFSERFSTKYSRQRWVPTPDQIRDFCEYAWPGNLRQLSHVIEQGYVLDTIPELPIAKRKPECESALPCTDLSRLRGMALRQALRTTGGHKGRAAKLLGVHPNTMTRLISQVDDVE